MFVIDIKRGKYNIAKNKGDIKYKYFLNYKKANYIYDKSNILQISNNVYKETVLYIYLD